jgi:hypothetical protein
MSKELVRGHSRDAITGKFKFDGRFVYPAAKCCDPAPHSTPHLNKLTSLQEIKGTLKFDGRFGYPAAKCCDPAPHSTLHLNKLTSLHDWRQIEGYAQNFRMH